MTDHEIFKVGIFCLSCDRYNYMTDHFIRFANNNLHLPYTLFTETYIPIGKEIIPLGAAPWNIRFKQALELMKDYEDVIYLQEDFLIKYVDEAALYQAYGLHKKYKACITKLGTNFEFNINKFPETIFGHQVYLQNPADTYLMSHQPIILSGREFLLSTISEQTPDASAHEIEGSNIMRAMGQTKVFTIGESYHPNRSDIFTIEHGIRKGELLPEAERLINDGL